MQLAANADTFMPPEWDDPAFVRWAHRAVTKVRNLPPGSGEPAMRRALFADGTPSPEWASAFHFGMMLSRSNTTHAT